MATLPEAGLLEHKGKALGVALWDLDGDGLLDVTVANDTRPNFIFENRGNGRFDERGLDLGVAYDDTGRARAGMGIDIAEYSGDGVPSIAIGNFSGESMSLWRRRPDGLFDPHAESAGLSRSTNAPLAFAVRFLDADLDGRLDLAIVNGHIEPDIAEFLPGQEFKQPSQLFPGTDGQAFGPDVALQAESDFGYPRVGRGLATGDIDRDGDLDLLVTTNGGHPALLRNDVADPAASFHFLRVRLGGKGKNTAAIGARIAHAVSGATLKNFVAWVLVAVGVFMAIRVARGWFGF